MKAGVRTLRPEIRPLRPEQRRLLRVKSKTLKAQANRQGKALWLGAGVILALWFATLAVSNSPWWIITLFWVLVGLAILLWVARDLEKERRLLLTMAGRLLAALERGEAEVFDITSKGYVELAEIEDEGACYAFDLGHQTLFVVGQEFYPSARFPSLDFSLIYPLDDLNQAVDMFIVKRAPKAAPLRILPASAKKRLNVPEHLSLLDCKLTDIEEALRP